MINFSSIGARRGGGAYDAAKAAVKHFTATLATELGPRGVTATVVAPGLILGTEFVRGRLTDERRQRLVAETRNGRAGTPADVVAAVTCECPAAEAYRRYVARAGQGHAGHLDHLPINRRKASTVWAPLALGGPLLRVDTSQSVYVPVAAWVGGQPEGRDRGGAGD